MRIVLVSVLLLVPLTAALAPAPATGSPCGFVDGVGEACPVPGGYEVVTANGRRLFTHGPDALPAAELTTALLAVPRDPPCVADPGRDYHSHFLYVHPATQPDRSAEILPALRKLVREANGLLWLEGSEFGAPVEYRFRCDADGQVTVTPVAVPLPGGRGQYAALVNALTALGFVESHAKYWVWYDDPSSCSCGGIAAAPLDPDRSPLNPANGGPYFGVTYGYFNALIPMHENGHNLGVVNNAAPDTSGAGHCNDGRDIMCYADGGPQSAYSNKVCTDRTHFDCHHDTYFHPDPPAGTFLASKWQIGAPINRFVQGCAYIEVDLSPLSPSTVVDLPPECMGHRYAIYGRAPAEPAHTAIGPPPVRVTLNVFRVCWIVGEAVVDCPVNRPWGHEGRVPDAATRAEITWISGENGRATLSVI